MSRDYAKTRASRRRRRDARGSSKSGFTWLFVGITVAFIIIGLVFLKHKVAATVHPEKRLVVEDSVKEPKASIEKRESALSAKNKNTQIEEDKVDFDFYTILPNMKVNSSEPKKVEDNAAPTLLPSEDKNDLKNNDEQEQKPLGDKQVQSLEKNLLSPAVKAKSQHIELQKPAKLAADSSILPSKPNKKIVRKEPSAAASEKLPVTKKEEISSLPHKSSAPIVELTSEKLPKASHAVSSAYIVQIAAFKKFEDADRLKAQLNLAGFEAKVKAVSVSDETWHRVWLGPYPTTQAAEKIQKNLLRKHTKSVVIKVK